MTEKESPFQNTYGGLSLVMGADGKDYLKMGDCVGADCFGPLTDEQVAAFNLLCQVHEVETSVARALGIYG